MSKRVSNDRGRNKARYGRIRLGWKTIRSLQQYEKLNKALTGDLEDKIRDKYEAAKSALTSVLPKKLLRRHQGR